MIRLKGSTIGWKQAADIMLEHGGHIPDFRKERTMPKKKLSQKEIQAAQEEEFARRRLEESPLKLTKSMEDAYWESQSGEPEKKEIFSNRSL